MELADRLWPGVEGWFSNDDKIFNISGTKTLIELIESITNAELVMIRPDDPYSSPLIIGKPFKPLSIDWWDTEIAGARDLKVWAGKMESYGIALAMQRSLKDYPSSNTELFNYGKVVMTADDSDKKREPYYFDARRAPNSHSRDVGFSPNTLKLTTIAHPAVEFLCLVGLQVARPLSTQQPRVYEYFAWHTPLFTNLLMPVSSGLLNVNLKSRYRFENWFRTGQKKHKAFKFANQIIERN